MSVHQKNASITPTFLPVRLPAALGGAWRGAGALITSLLLQQSVPVGDSIALRRIQRYAVFLLLLTAALAVPTFHWDLHVTEEFGEDPKETMLVVSHSCANATAGTGRVYIIGHPQRTIV